MALTWTELKVKAQRLAMDSEAEALVQLEQDMNQGYELFNAKLDRYWSRKQQFTDIIDGQGIYQTPIDCVRIIGMTVAVSDTYQIPIKEVRSEFEWRQITAYPYSSNWPAYYFMIGNDELALWPTPSQDVTNGLRFYYQQQDHSLTIDDIVSSDLSPTQTCSVVNGSATVTSTGTTFTNQLIGLQFQVIGQTDTTWYEIVDVPTSSTLTLKSAYVSNSASGLNFRIGQMQITPTQYGDAIIHYALWLYFSSKGNENRANNHKALFDNAVDDAIKEYTSSSEGNVITSDGDYISSWYLTPLPPNS